MPRWLARGNWVWTVILATLALASTADAADAKKTIVIWDYNEYRDWVLEEFATTTGIHADYQFVDAGDPMMVRIVAGEVPDVIRVDKQDIGQYIFKDLVADLSAFAARDNFPYRDVVGLENVMWRGTLIGTMPLANTNAINFNEDMFLASGLETPDSLQRRDQWTWDNFLRAAKKLTVDNDGDGVFERRGYYFDVGYYASFFNWTWSNGGDAFHPDTLACQLGQDPVREALEFAASLVLEHRVVSSPGLGAGKVAMEDGWTGPQPNNEAISKGRRPFGHATHSWKTTPCDGT